VPIWVVRAEASEVRKRQHLLSLESDPIANTLLRLDLTLHFGAKDIHWAVAPKAQSTRQMNWLSAQFHLYWYGVQIYGETRANWARRGALDRIDKHVGLEGLTQTANRSEAFRSTVDR
jgi:hypothetical protein